MSKSSESVLFGVRGFQARRGMLHPTDWARLRTRTSSNGAGYGTMNTPEGVVIWFNDPVTRDEFQKLFNGTSVTLTRKIEVHSGPKALKMIKEMQR